MLIQKFSDRLSDGNAMRWITLTISQLLAGIKDRSASNAGLNRTAPKKAIMIASLVTAAEG